MLIGKTFTTPSNHNIRLSRLSVLSILLLLATPDSNANTLSVSEDSILSVSSLSGPSAITPRDELTTCHSPRPNHPPVTNSTELNSLALACSKIIFYCGQCLSKLTPFELLISHGKELAMTESLSRSFCGPEGIGSHFPQCHGPPPDNVGR